METGSDARRGMEGVGDDAAGLLAEFRTWLDRERGLSPESVQLLLQARRRHSWQRPAGPEAVSGLDAGTVTAFMVEHSRRTAASWSAKAMVTSLRAFLRFAHATGKTASPAGHRGTRRSRRGGCPTLPRSLKAE